MHVQAHTHSHPCNACAHKKHRRRCRHAPTHTHARWVCVCTFVYAGSDVFYNLSRCPLPPPRLTLPPPPPAHPLTHTHAHAGPKPYSLTHSRFLALLPPHTEKNPDFILMNEDEGPRTKQLDLVIVNYKVSSILHKPSTHPFM